MRHTTGTTGTTGTTNHDQPRPARPARRPARRVEAARPTGTCDLCMCHMRGVLAIATLRGQVPGDSLADFTVCAPCWDQVRARVYTGAGCDLCRASLRHGSTTLYADATGDSVTLCLDCAGALRHARTTRQYPKLPGDARH